MGLSSAMSTALTGLNAAETTLDVIGNNLANSNTVGFKSSKAVFATQFLQTRSLGAAPTETNGGTNPRQIGLGTQVAEIVTDFTQGTVQISSPEDLAIQGDGFFMVQGAQGEFLYTRNGIFTTNAENQLVTVTGHRVLGFGIDDNFQIQTTDLVPLEIPLGSAAVAQATENVFLEGTLIPNGDLADTAEVIQSAILGNAAVAAPANAPDTATSAEPDDNLTIGQTPGGDVAQGFYRYKVVFVDGSGNESTPSEDILVEVADPTGATIDISDIPDNPAYVARRIYRSEVQGSAALTDPPPNYYLVGEVPAGDPTPVVDNLDDAALTANAQLDNDILNGNYSYYITYTRAGQPDSRPAPLTVPVIVNNGRIELSNFPPDPTGQYDGIRIWRNLSTDNARFYEVAEVGFGDTFIDNYSDAELLANDVQIDLDGPRITAATLLVDVLQRDGNNYNRLFEEGTLSFAGQKGGRSMSTKEFEITGNSTVLDLMNFMEDALGIQRPPGNDPVNQIPGTVGGFNVGGDIVNGRITLAGNNGVDNAISIGISSMKLTTATGERQINMPFGSTQKAVGESAVADFIVYDSLGIPNQVRVTMALESRDGVSATYRWFADSPDNQPQVGTSISVGTGLITFDGEGNLITTTNSTVSIDRRDVPATSPLEFDLDFSQLVGLAANKSTLAASRQDGSAPGVLSSYIVGEDGVIRGVFSNGVTRDLGQIRLAAFANPRGLEQKGQNLYGAGINSGLPVMGNPGEQGIGSIRAGALELSNTDIGANLVDMILASTMYRGNTRVVTTAQQLFDELLNIRR